MIFPSVAALAFTLATVPVVLLWSIVTWLRRRRQRPLWRRALWLHAGLFVLHLFVTFPLALGYVGSRVVGTRGPDRPYAGPRLDAAGDLIVQSTATLRREAENGCDVAPSILARAAERAHYVPSSDGVTLRVFRLEARVEPPRAVAVLVHGLFRCAVEVEPVAAMLRDRGCECWLLDLRNHGGSTRAPFTGGLRECDDVVAAVRHVREQPGRASTPLFLYGVSLGSIAVALALPRIDGIAGVVLDSPIDDLHAAAHRMLSFHRPDDRRSWFRQSEPWRSLVIASLGAWSGFRVEEVAPAEVLATLPHDLPMLVIGGGTDDRAPPESVERLFARLPMPASKRELWIEPDGGHGDLSRQRPDQYAACLERLLARLRR
ncbi:MAG: alpha/beta fold hydrolase [Planctomycetes bacterium]|nr:alpha/beta fold hydrolase [Planctomycetota bacterium]